MGGSSAADGTPFRLDPDFLRSRVGELFEVLLAAGAESRPMGLQPEEINRHCPKGIRATTDGDRCPVCLEPSQAGEEIRTLPCGHELHCECCEAWLTTANTCPACRYRISQD